MPTWIWWMVLTTRGHYIPSFRHQIEREVVSSPLSFCHLLPFLSVWRTRACVSSADLPSEGLTTSWCWPLQWLHPSTPPELQWVPGNSHGKLPPPHNTGVTHSVVLLAGQPPSRSDREPWKGQLPTMKVRKHLSLVSKHWGWLLGPPPPLGAGEPWYPLELLLFSSVLPNEKVTLCPHGAKKTVCWAS